MKGGRLLLGFLIVFFLWYVVSLIVGTRLVPYPHDVLLYTLRNFLQHLLKHTAASFVRVLFSLIIAVVMALPLGILMGRKKSLDRIFSPLTYILYPIPKTALLPVLLLLFGIGNLSKVLLLLLVLFFQVLLNLRDGAARINEEYLLSVRSLGASPLQRFRFVIFPAVLPRLLTSLRTGSGTALAVLFFAETFFTEYGLGFYIMDSWIRVSYTEMFSGILCISLLGLGIFLGIDALEHRFCRWKE